MSYSQYQKGYKYCGECCKFVKTDGNICPKCFSRVRRGPRSKRLKRDMPRIG